MCAIRRGVTVCALTDDNILAMLFVKNCTQVTPLRGLLIVFDYFWDVRNTVDVGLSSKCSLDPKFSTADKPLLDMNYLIVLRHLVHLWSRNLSVQRRNVVTNLHFYVIYSDSLNLIAERSHDVCISGCLSCWRFKDCCQIPGPVIR